MDNRNELSQSILAIKNTLKNQSWFRDTAYRWPQASLPLAYAMACVEVVSKMSNKAGVIYKQIVEAWGNPGIKAIYEAIISDVPDSEMKKMINALIHPETEFFPDPTKPFKQLEEMFTGIEINEDIFQDDDYDQLSTEDQKDAEEFAKLICLIFEFIIVGFNKESDLEKGKYRVFPSEKFPWLIFAVIMRTSFESFNVTLERLGHIYKVRKYKGKTIDFEKILTEQPMSRLHRMLVASGKAAKLKLKNDRIFMNAARAWYQCRVVYGSVEKYCDEQSKLGIILDPKNVDKQIRPCDDALGYIRRLPRKTIQ
jgi:hypothetical protein